MDEQKDAIGIVGRFEWFQYGPEGEVKAHGVGENLVTTVGDNFIAARQYGTPTVMGNMKLGSAATAVTKTGAGSYVGTGDYVGGSAHAEGLEVIAAHEAHVSEFDRGLLPAVVDNLG